MMIFIVGHARSGTTMMSRILGAHPLVHRLEELHFFDKLWNPADAQAPLPPDRAAYLSACLSSISQQGFFQGYPPMPGKVTSFFQFNHINSSEIFAHKLYQAFITREAISHGKAIPCKHTPQYIYYLSDILSLLGDAKIISMIRDPRDVLLSMKNRWRRPFLTEDRRPVKMNIHAMVHVHPIFTSFMWKRAVAIALKYKHHPQVHTINFESILTSPKGEIKRICNFLDIPFYAEILDVPAVGSSFVKDRPHSKGIDSRRSNYWRARPSASTDLFINQMIVGPEMKGAGYQKVAFIPNPIMLLWHFCTFFVKGFLTIILQINSVQRLRVLVKRRFL